MVNVLKYFLGDLAINDHAASHTKAVGAPLLELQFSISRVLDDSLRSLFM